MFYVVNLLKNENVGMAAFIVFVQNNMVKKTGNL